MNNMDQTLEFHPYADIFPLVLEGSVEWLALHTSLKVKAHMPVWLYQGKILDGRTRYSIAKKYPEVELEFREFTGDDQEALEFSRALNAMRRNLDQSQRAMVAIRYWRHCNGKVTDENLVDKFCVGKTLIKQANKIESDSRQEKHVLIQAILAGELPINTAMKYMDNLLPSQWEDAILNDGKKLLREAKAKDKELTKERDLSGAVHSKNRNGEEDITYGVIYTTFDSGVTLPVADTCAVFMWARPEQLFNAVSSLEADGFTGKVFNFIRTSGKPVNYNVEHLICATKGNPPIPAFQQNLMANINGTALPTQYAEAIAETYKVPILSMLNPQVKHKGTNWDYEPAIQTETKVTRKGSSKRKSKQSTNSGRKVDTDDAVTGPSYDVEPAIQSGTGETIQ